VTLPPASSLAHNLSTSAWDSHETKSEIAGVDVDCGSLSCSRNRPRGIYMPGVALHPNGPAVVALANDRGCVPRGFFADTSAAPPLAQPAGAQRLRDAIREVANAPILARALCRKVRRLRRNGSERRLLPADGRQDSPDQSLSLWKFDSEIG
jgi:hypothetical protein